ncbi:MAG: Gfo/Idh/MocA family oxidoreductase, partial [Planctomycetaceae bacterium]|nr:Gfo/Idh/MocA family oxidoreductase [Planctomycetaceae bacterium]
MMNRRDFISHSAAIGSGIAMAAPLISAAEDVVAPSKKLRIGLAGCGRQGRTILNAGMKISGMMFVAVCDILPSALRSAKFYLEAEAEENDESVTVAAYADFQDMIDREKTNLDAVVIATPDFLHAAQTREALTAGLHVYCEPMMATNAEDARSMIKLAGDKSLLLQIGFERRSDPRYRHAVQNLLTPESLPVLLGTITHLETQANRRIHSELAWAERDTLSSAILERYGYESMSQYRNWKQYRKYGNGQCAGFLAQQLDVFDWFFGIRPLQAVVSGGLDYYKYGDCFDNTAALITYPFPKRTVRAVSRAWTTTSAAGSIPFEHIYGANGSLQTSLSDEFFRVYAEPGLAKWGEFVRRGDLKKAVAVDEKEDPNLVKVRETGNVVPYMLPMQRESSVTRLHLENFVNAVIGKEKLHCSGEDA